MDHTMRYEVKDSGEREEFASGMVRDTEAGKTDYTYVIHGPMLQRWAEHLMKGAEKYEKNNWLLANDKAALDRYQRSALRHMIQWLLGEDDEDHAAAVFFNINGAEYVRAQLVMANSSLGSSRYEGAYHLVGPEEAMRADREDTERRDRQT